MKKFIIALIIFLMTASFAFAQLSVKIEGIRLQNDIIYMTYTIIDGTLRVIRDINVRLEEVPALSDLARLILDDLNQYKQRKTTETFLQGYIGNTYTEAQLNAAQ